MKKIERIEKDKVKIIVVSRVVDYNFSPWLSARDFCDAYALGKGGNNVASSTGEASFDSVLSSYQGKFVQHWEQVKLILFCTSRAPAQIILQTIVNKHVFH